MNLNYYPNFDSDFVSKSLVETYYTGVSSNGFGRLLYMFSNDCNCTLNDVTFQGAHNTLVAFTEAGILKENFDQLKYSFQPVGTDSLMVSVDGYCQFVYLYNNNWNVWNTQHSWKKFSETFVVKWVDEKLLIVNHVLKVF